MHLTPLITRLQTQCPALRQVIHALAGTIPPAYPAAFVIPLSVKALPSTMLGRHSQRLDETFGVEIMLKHAGQAASGGPAAEQLEPVREAVRAALAGWSPSADHTPINYLGGRLISFEAGMVIWREEFTTQHYQENI